MQHRSGRAVAASPCGLPCTLKWPAAESKCSCAAVPRGRPLLEAAADRCCERLCTPRCCCCCLAMEWEAIKSRAGFHVTINFIPIHGHGMNCKAQSSVTINKNTYLSKDVRFWPLKAYWISGMNNSVCNSLPPQYVAIIRSTIKLWALRTQPSGEPACDHSCAPAVRHQLRDATASTIPSGLDPRVAGSG